MRKLLLFLVLLLFFIVPMSSATVYFFEDNVDFDQWSNSGWDSSNVSGHEAFYKDVYTDTLTSNNLTTITNGDAQYRFEFQMDSTADTRVDTFLYDDSSGKKFRMRLKVDGSNFTTDIYDYDFGNYVISAGADLGVAGDTSWHNVTFAKLESEWKVNIDGDLNFTGSAQTDVDISQIRYENDGSSTYDGFKIGKFVIADTIPELEYSSSSINSLFVVLNTPLNNTHLSDSTPELSFNYSHSSGLSGNCTFYVNETVVGESLNVLNGSSNESVVVNVSLGDGGYDWFVSCTDGVDTINSSSYSFVVDTVNPIITWNTPANDNSTFLEYNSSLLLDIDGDDFYIFAFNFTLFNSSGSVIYNNYTENITESSITIGDTVSLLNENSGLLTAQTSLWDDHTDLFYVPDNVDVKNPKEIVVDGLKIKAQNFNSTNLSYQVGASKVSFCFEPDGKAPKEKTYVVDCESNLYNRAFTDYKGHFVCFPNWVDFENFEDKPVSKIDFLNLTSAVVHTEASCFESTGGLNHVVENRTLTIDSYRWDCEDVSQSITTNGSDFNCTTGFDISGNNLVFDANNSQIEGFINVTGVNVTITGLDALSNVEVVGVGLVAYDNTFRGVVNDVVSGSKFCNYSSNIGNFYIGGFYQGLNVQSCPDIDEFDGLTTTNFSSLNNWTDVNLTLDNSYGVISWIALVDLAGSDAGFDSYVSIVQDRVEVVRDGYPALNVSAGLTFKNVVVDDVSDVALLRDGVSCGVVCTNLAYDGSSDTFTVDVTKFSNYTITYAASGYSATYTVSDAPSVIIDFWVAVLVSILGLVVLVVLWVLINLFRGFKWNGKKGD